VLTPQSLPWSDPLDLAARIDEPCWVLLYSAVNTHYSGRYSYLACNLSERIEAADFTLLAQKLGSGQPALDNAWFGYLSYELKDALERPVPTAPGGYSLPPLCMMQFRSIYQFDHDSQTLTLWSDTPHRLPPARPASPRPVVTGLTSNMTRTQYLENVATILEHIRAGDLYQANLTRKFTGQFDRTPDYFALFAALCKASPACYSAFIRRDDTYILSSSPELFLHADAQGHIRTRPIKGTAPRFADAAPDAASRLSLAASLKDRAENLMITDLMRNDLSRSCLPGSVHAHGLFEVTTHASVHHMSSTITGQQTPGCTTLQAVRHAFPPGSMTGAPKLEAIRLCSQLEMLDRGVYSGALGWFGGDGSCELSVVIRTLILHGDRFEFQVGGGIVADSIPERELEELFDKASGIMLTLGINKENMENAGL
jgi:para-aminobenzoate synthetase component 1